MNNEIKIQPSKGNNKVEISNNFAQYFEQLAKKHADDAKESELLAKDWANKLGSTVDDTEYSAKHYALKSKEEHDGAVTDIATAKTELEQSIATGLEDYNTNAQAKSDSLQTQFDTSISDIKKQETTSINAVKTTQTTAESSITELKTSAELTITNGMADITSNKEQSMSAINENRETSLAEIESAKSGAVSAVNTTKDNAVSTVKQTGTDEYNKILSTGIDSKLGENLITNCLKEIPQRIKYTLVDGVLTILKGSVCIVPYGTEDKTADFPKGATFINENFKVYDTQFSDGKFFVWAELVNDISSSYTVSDTRTRILSIALKTNEIAGAIDSVSSETPSASQYTVVYNTSTNFVGYTHEDSTIYYSEHVPCLPFMFVLANGKTPYGSIQQLFNGTGYIGSTVWVDKGVKGLCPNGRSADGTLINEEVVTDKLILGTIPDTSSADRWDMILDKGSTDGNITVWNMRSKYLYEQETPPNIISSEYQFWNNTATNAWFESSADKWSKRETVKSVQIGSLFFNGSTITSFAPGLPFRALDYSDKSTITNWSFPSGKYIDLTLGANGTTYTAPADGWFMFRAPSNNVANTYIDTFVHTNKQLTSTATYIVSFTGDTCWFMHQVQKGAVLTFLYNTTFASITAFRFIYGG